MRWVKEQEKFQFVEKVDILRRMKLKKIKAGDRIANQTDTIDSFYLVVKGKVGVLYSEQ
jgi:CRP-like cAMP-binding protein